MSCWADSAPSKEYLLRQEYPDLEEKWITYLNLQSIFLDKYKELKKFGIIKRFLNHKEYNRVFVRCMKAKTLQDTALEEYTILEKLLWDY